MTNPQGLAGELRDGWRCFQCDKVFTDRSSAEGHFGMWPHHSPACMAGESFQTLKTAYNNLEADYHALKRALQPSGDRREEIETAGLNAKLPSHFRWGSDAMEQFEYGKRRATETILALLASPVSRDGELLASCTVSAATTTPVAPSTDAGSGWRPEVRAFADLMEQTLRKNDHKGTWKGEARLWLLSRLREEVQELEEAISYAQSYDTSDRGARINPWGAVGREAADVANFAMMIADVCGALPPARAMVAASPTPPAGDGHS